MDRHFLCLALGLDFSILGAINPELRQNGQVRGALEQRAKDERQRASCFLVVRHLVEIAKEPHADEADSEACRVPLVIVELELG